MKYQIKETGLCSAESDDSENISVISIDELFSPTSFEVMSKVLKRVHTENSKARLFEILISEEYTEDQSSWKSQVCCERSYKFNGRTCFRMINQSQMQTCMTTLGPSF